MRLFLLNTDYKQIKKTLHFCLPTIEEDITGELASMLLAITHLTQLCPLIEKR